MSLYETKSPRGLERKLKVIGFEIPDLIIICFVLTFLNFVFGPLGHRLTLVFVPSLILAVSLYFGKRGKPDKHLEHWIRFELAPKELFAWPKDQIDSPARRLVNSRRFK